MHHDAMTPKAWYQAACETPGFVRDARQSAVVEQMEMLWHELATFEARQSRFFWRNVFGQEAPRGLYLWGAVGGGKTFLMDGFYQSLPLRRKRRIHFHDFMLEVHREMKRLAGERDPLLALADSIERSARLLCLDEFHVDDIADAMILGRLLEALIERGVVLVATSNDAPDDLYSNGMQRQKFLPAIALLRRALTVMHLDSDTDFRMRQSEYEPVFGMTADAEVHERMQDMFRRLAGDVAVEPHSIRVGRRNIPARCVARDAVWFSFKELCGGYRDQSDYVEIARRYPAVFVSGIPEMAAENRAETRRFTWLIDVLYDNRVKLVASFEVAPEALYGRRPPDGEARRISSRLAEMRTRRYLELPHCSRGAIPEVAAAMQAQIPTQASAAGT